MFPSHGRPARTTRLARVRGAVSHKENPAASLGYGPLSSARPGSGKPLRGAGVAFTPLGHPRLVLDGDHLLAGGGKVRPG